MSYITLDDLAQANNPSDLIIAQAQMSVGASNVVVLTTGQASPTDWVSIPLPDGRILAAIPNVSLSLASVGAPCPAGLIAVPVDGTSYQICVIPSSAATARSTHARSTRSTGSTGRRRGP